jgi:hypothetical protein
VTEPDDGRRPDEDPDPSQDGPALTTDEEAQRDDTPADPDTEAS